MTRLELESHRERARQGHRPGAAHAAAARGRLWERQRAGVRQPGL